MFDFLEEQKRERGKFQNHIYELSSQNYDLKLKARDNVFDSAISRDPVMKDMYSSHYEANMNQIEKNNVSINFNQIMADGYR